MADPPGGTLALLSSLRRRIEALEKSSWSSRDDVVDIVPECRSKTSTRVTTNYVDDDDDDGGDGGRMIAHIPPPPPEGVRRARRHVQISHCHSSVWKFVRPPPSVPSSTSSSSVTKRYYSMTLEERRVVLGAHSTSQLCKSCLFENRNYAATTTPHASSRDGDDDDTAASHRGVDPTNSRYYLIVVRYVESINARRLGSELRGLRPPGPHRYDASYFSDMRLAPSDVSDRLTGYGHNGVCPFGMLDDTIPIVVCSSIVRGNDGGGGGSKFVWMGGGHEDWKLGVSTSEFVRGVNALVLDVSEPRVSG